MKLESPAVILSTVRASWWPVLKAGWRLWPIAHLVTYTVIPRAHRYAALPAWSSLNFFSKLSLSLNVEEILADPVVADLAEEDFLLMLLMMLMTLVAPAVA